MLRYVVGFLNRLAFGRTLEKITVEQYHSSALDDPEGKFVDGLAEKLRAGGYVRMVKRPEYREEGKTVHVWEGRILSINGEIELREEVFGRAVRAIGGRESITASLWYPISVGNQLDAIREVLEEELGKEDLDGE